MKSVLGEVDSPGVEQVLWFFSEWSNGFGFFWTWPEGGEDGSSIMSIEEATQSRDKIRTLAAEFWTDDELRGEFEGDGLDIALRMRRRMTGWLPLIEEGNGDYLCVDLEQGGRVVMYCHDWADSTGIKPDGTMRGCGVVVASDLLEFFEGWSRVCFSTPKRFWTGVAIRGGLSWDEGTFEPEYVRE